MSIGLCVLASLVASGGASPKLALAPLRASGITPEQAAALTEVLSTEAAGLGFDVISSRDIDAILRHSADQEALGCDDTACLAEIGGALGADKLLVSQVDKLEGSYVVNLKLVDSRGIRIDARFYESVRGDLDAVVDALRPGVRQLFGATSRGIGLPGVTTLGMWAVGLVGVGVGVGFGLDAQSHYDRASDPTYPGGAYEVAPGKRSQNIANAGFAVGGLAALSGLAYWLFFQERAHGIAISAAPGPSASMLTVTTSF